jgi:hypothetical protein
VKWDGFHDFFKQSGEAFSLGHSKYVKIIPIHCLEDLRILEKHFSIALRFASTPTRATPARVGDPGVARRPIRSAQGKLYGVRKLAFLCGPSTYEPMYAQERAHAGSTLRFARRQAVLGYSLSPPSAAPLQKHGEELL